MYVLGIGFLAHKNRFVKMLFLLIENQILQMMRKLSCVSIQLLYVLCLKKGNTFRLLYNYISMFFYMP